MAVKVPVLSSLVNPINGVPVFFLISGFLIWLSIGRTKDFKSFCIKNQVKSSINHLRKNDRTF